MRWFHRYNEYNRWDSSIYVFEDAVLYNKTEFIAYFLQRLNFTQYVTAILDRASDIGQAVLQHKGDSKVGVVIHAHHYSNKYYLARAYYGTIIMNINFQKLNTSISYYSNRYSKSYGLLHNLSILRLSSNVSYTIPWE